MTFAVHDEHGTEVGSGRLDGQYDPLRVVRWLRDHLRTSGTRLEPGHLLSLGNLDITRQLKPDSPQGSPAYRGSRFTLSYYGPVGRTRHGVRHHRQMSGGAPGAGRIPQDFHQAARNTNGPGISLMRARRPSRY